MNSERSGVRSPGRQSGASLMETMIALSLSTVVISAMVILMGNSIGTSNRVIQMTQLTDELRNVMSLMTRDVRRANYSSAAILCYGFAGCANDTSTLQFGGGAVQVDEDDPAYITASGSQGDVIIAETADGLCMLFQLDRSGTGNATADSKGGFRRSVYDIGDREVGVIEMWVHVDADVPNCFAEPEWVDDDGNGWVPVTDPNIVDITLFEIEDALSVEKEILQDGGATSYTQRQRQLTLAIEGELVLEQGLAWLQAQDDLAVQRRVEDVIRVRNDFLSPPPSS